MVPGISGTYVEAKTRQETLEKMTTIAVELSLAKFSII
jgi:hypothetical protein